MAAPGDHGEVRVRLLFDYPPPALPQSRHLWFMLDTGQCRAITDVTAIIRERFFYSHGGALSLYLDGCLLPPGESVRLIRDNDAISVKWEDSRAHDGPHQSTKKSVVDGGDDCRYLQKTMGGYRASPEKWREEERSERMKKKREVTPEGKVSKWPKKKRRQRLTSEDEVKEQLKKKEVTEDEEEAGKKPKKKKKKEVIEDEEEAGKKPKKKKEEEEVTKDEEEAGKKPKKKKKKQVSEDEEEAGMTPKKKKEEEVTKGEEEAGKKPKKKEEMSVPEVSKSGLSEPKTKKSPHVVPSLKTPPLNNTYRKESSSSSDSEDRGGQGRRVEPGLPLRMQQRAGSAILTTSPPMCNGHVTQHRPPLVSAGRGSDWGRGLDNQPPRGRGLRGQGEEKPHNHFFYNYSPEARKQQQLNEDVSHVSVVVQNPPEVPIKDYSALPLLAAPPQPGNVLAFKLLELTENYTPEISDYKEGRVLSYNPVSQQLEVEILSQQKRKEPGKFDLVYELEDGTDIVEYAVPQECKISQAWSALIEPRLVTGLTAVVTPGP